LRQQLRQVEAQAQQQLEVSKLATGITTFCERVRRSLDELDFAQRRQLVELLIDCVVVTDERVEIRYVIPTGPAGEGVPFCHLRLDYLNPPALPVQRHHILCRQPLRLQHVGQIAIPLALMLPGDEPQRVGALAVLLGADLHNLVAQR
jgi:hypothetical protein